MIPLGSRTPATSYQIPPRQSTSSCASSPKCDNPTPTIDRHAASSTHGSSSCSTESASHPMSHAPACPETTSTTSHIPPSPPHRVPYVSDQASYLVSPSNSAPNEPPWLSVLPLPACHIYRLVHCRYAHPKSPIECTHIPNQVFACPKDFFLPHILLPLSPNSTHIPVSSKGPPLAPSNVW